MAVVSIASPHAHDNSSIQRLMMHVCFALTPCTLFGLYYFGLPALWVFLLTVSSAIIFESICLKLLNKPQDSLFDGSALLTGWLLALSLPPWAPWWICVGGSFVAIVIGKQLYGGIGQNVFNPAMLARVALLISFPVQMTTWPLPLDHFFSIDFITSIQILASNSAIPDGYTGATALGELKTELTTGATANQYINESFNGVSALIGTTGGSLGETSAILVALGGCWLLLMRIITWHIPVAMIATAAGLSSLFYLINPEQYAGPIFHCLSGGMLLGAFFIATDLVTSPSSPMGKILFGTGCGALDYIIRVWGGFPEGIGFAVLFMNALTPLIDLYFRPRIYGRKYDGSPKSYAQSQK